MNYNLAEQVSGEVAAQKQKRISITRSVDRRRANQAVGKHVLLQVEVDQKIAWQIIAIRSTRDPQTRAPQTNPAGQLPMTIRSK
jgi:hypothetical protein